MKLSWSEKERFYHEVGQYTKSGIGIQEALQSIAEGGDTAAARRIAKRLRKLTAGGDDLFTVFSRQTGVFTELELALLEAGEHSGRLEQVFHYLARYFHDLREARSEVIRRAIYPLFLLHFAVLVLPFPALITGGLTPAAITTYLMKSVGTLLIVYFAAFTLIMIIMSLLRVSRYAPGSDTITRRLPLMGKIRSSASISRFCMALEMQLQAGVPMMQALPVAGRASQSGLILNRVDRALPKIDGGASLSEALGGPGPLPANVLRGLSLGQQAGTLDEELGRWGAFYLDQALTRIRLLSDWLPKILYFLIVAYVAYRIVTSYAASMADTAKLLDSI